MASQILIRLPDELAIRLKSVVPARQRNQFVAQSVERALVDRERALAQIADAVMAEEAADADISAELEDWERSTISDGLDKPV